SACATLRGWPGIGHADFMSADSLFLPCPLTLPPPMSDPRRYPGGKMKTLVNGINEPGHWNLIACFGEARLLNRADGRVELRGGSEADRTEAKEWVSLFMHEAVLRIIVSN
ncbi:MAG TPA: hypothetical protein VNM37_04245, partial [Candidatus Dormibacteraeota bacterium]|nr:hypothetical protein [Candidatus Dormibacteraeota bacterium]